jgi:hypothetical protein
MEGLLGMAMVGAKSILDRLSQTGDIFWAGFFVIFFGLLVTRATVLAES